MKDSLWHYNNFVAFNKIVFGKTITESNILSQGKLFQSAVFFEIDTDGDVTEFYPPKREDTFYYQIAKDNEQYLLPQRFIEEMPIMIAKKDNGELDIKEVKLKKSDKDFWKYIRKVNSYHMPKKRMKPFKWYIDNFNPMGHDDPKTATFLKLLAHSNGTKIAVCAPPRSGKQANYIILKQMVGKINPALTPCTRPVFYNNLLYNETIVIDEVTSWKPSEMSIIEDDIKNLGDVNPEHNKHSLNSKGQLSTVDIISKGLIFTFNPLTKNNPQPFDAVFQNFDKIEDRIPIIYVPGKARMSIDTPSRAEAESNVMSNFNKYKNWCMMAAYFTSSEIEKELHNYDYSLNPFKDNVRFYANTKPLIKSYDAYCDTQEEFNEWMLWLKERIKDYKIMRYHTQTTINKITEEFI